VVDVAQPLAVRAGELWQQGALEIHQEHLLSDCLSTQLRVLRSMFDDAPGPVVLLTTLPGELHGLGLEMIALHLATAGAAPRVLGVSTPVEQIVRAARVHQAAVVGLAVMPSSDLPATRDALRQLIPQLAPGTALWLGGGGVAGLPPLPGARVLQSWAEMDAALAAAPAAAASRRPRVERGRRSR
jgi:methylmalonyl-CoA mutase cobalamin-binding subunit